MKYLKETLFSLMLLLFSNVKANVSDFLVSLKKSNVKAKHLNFYSDDFYTIPANGGVSAVAKETNDCSGDCNNGYGTLKVSENGSPAYILQGTFSNGLLINGKKYSVDKYWNYDNKRLFEGTWKNGKPYTGSGNYLDDGFGGNFCLYSGTWKEGYGKGTITKSYEYYDASRNIYEKYEGEWSDLAYNGYGKLYRSLGDKNSYKLEYDGYWKRWNPYGKGVEYDAAGLGRYEGNFNEEGFDKRFGTYYYSNNWKYIGQFGEYRYFNGIGKLYDNNGVLKYDGSFTESKFNGNGTYYFDNGKYVGKWVNGKRTGYGIYYWNSGSRYEGYWLNDNRHGYGTTYNSQGNWTERGTYHNDQCNNCEHPATYSQRDAANLAGLVIGAAVILKGVSAIGEALSNSSGSSGYSSSSSSSSNKVFTWEWGNNDWDKEDNAKKGKRGFCYRINDELIKCCNIYYETSDYIRYEIKIAYGGFGGYQDYTTYYWDSKTGIAEKYKEKLGTASSIETACDIIINHSIKIAKE